MGLRSICCGRAIAAFVPVFHLEGHAEGAWSRHVLSTSARPRGRPWHDRKHFKRHFRGAHHDHLGRRGDGRISAGCRFGRRCGRPDPTALVAPGVAGEPAATRRRRYRDAHGHRGDAGLGSFRKAERRGRLSARARAATGLHGGPCTGRPGGHARQGCGAW